MHYIFRVEEILESKPFKERGVGITTNSMCASVHFIVRGKPDDDEAMLQSVQALSLTPHDDDDVDDEDDAIKKNDPAKKHK